MNMQKFIIYTSIGAGIWALILMVFGFVVWENKELFLEYKYHFTIASIVGISLLIYIKIKVLRYLQKDTQK